MEALVTLCKNVTLLDSKEIFTEVFSNDELKSYIIGLNTWKQLFEDGVDSHGSFMPYYRQSTVDIKAGVKIDGTVFSTDDHITLRDSGNWYKSFQVEVSYGFLDIEADPLKGRNEQRFGDDVIGLNETSREILVEQIQDDVAEKVQNHILRY